MQLASHDSRLAKRVSSWSSSLPPPTTVGSLRSAASRDVPSDAVPRQGYSGGLVFGRKGPVYRTHPSSADQVSRKPLSMTSGSAFVFRSDLVIVTAILLLCSQSSWRCAATVVPRFQEVLYNDPHVTFAGSPTPARPLLPPEQFCQSLGCSCHLEQSLACHLDGDRITAIPQILSKERAFKITDM